MAKGNRQATGGAAKKGEHLVVRTRGAILNAFNAVENRGKVLSEILADAFEANPLRFLDTAAKFIPKDVNLTTSTGKPADMTDDELQEVIAERAKARREEIRKELENQQDTLSDTG